MKKINYVSLEAVHTPYSDCRTISFLKVKNHRINHEKIKINIIKMKNRASIYYYVVLISSIKYLTPIILITLFRL